MSVTKTAQAFFDRHTVQYIGAGVWIAVDWERATAPIMVAYGADRAAGGDFHPTPYQTADTSYRGMWNVRRAAELVREYVR